MLGAEWSVPVPLGVRMIEADMLASQDPAAAVGAYEQIAAEAKARGAPGLVAFGTWARVLTRHYAGQTGLEDGAREAVEMSRAHGQPTALASSRCVLALVSLERDPVQARQLLDEAAAVVAPVRDRFTQLRVELVRARIEIELAGSAAGPIAASALARVFEELARRADLASRWQLFAMAAYLLAFRPADDVATVVGIFEHREVENNRRQWQDGVARARDELGAERFAELVAVGASLSDEEAVAFLCEPP